MTNALLATDIKPVAIDDEMKRSYLDYAMSVIVSRALPDVRDGLKPVHRRILYAMKEANNEYNRPYRKSARTVGDVMGKYHPHGNAAIYDAMVRMAQDFSLRVPLIDGQGNFGSMDGDPAAAERYTEARLSRAAHDLLEDIDRDTVDYQPNYDDSTVEPKVLPAKFPNILVNGANGIAVGMATNIPPHNLGEVIDACCALIENPHLEVEDLMQYMAGPDFPTGGIIVGRAGILDAFRTGRGSVVMRGKTHTETVRGEREAIIIDEIPYQVNKARLVERIAEIVKEKIVEGISDLRDESDRDGVRVVIELKRDAVADVVLNQLYRYTSLQTSFGVNMLALNHGRPEQMSIKQILTAFLAFREEVILRRTRFELAKAREKAHLFVGLAIAVANIDPIIELIRQAVDRVIAKEQLMGRDWPVGSVGPLLAIVDEPGSFVEGQNTYRLTDAQAQAILDLRLHRLTGLEREKIANDLNELATQIKELLDLLGNRQRVLAIMQDELLAVKDQFKSPRRTEIEEGDSSVDVEDLIQREEMVVTVSMEGYIKRVPLNTYRAQRRGGKGRSGMTTKEEDIVQDVFVANTHNPVLFFTTKGIVHNLKVYRLPLGSPTSKGRPMINMLPLSQGEKISTVLVMPEESADWDKMHIMFATSHGSVRRNKLSDFMNIRSNGKIAMKLDETEELIAVKTCTENDDVMLSTSFGKCIRFNVDEVRVFVGRDSTGVRGIKLAEGDSVISMTILGQAKVSTDERDLYLRQASKMRQLDDEEPEGEEITVEGTLTPERFKELAETEQFILTLTENGFGKRSSAFEYRTTGRGGVGVDSIIVNTRNGGVVASFPVQENDQIMLVTDAGKLIRCPIHDVRIAGRRTQGVTIFRVAEDERVVSVSHIPGDKLGEEIEDDDIPIEIIESIEGAEAPTVEKGELPEAAE
ncbi:DNA gyrase subunit A [Candidatus Odyssella acanthamoebae]|uniref:DNA gyrase subunit A n=1 Tax=Candidatus Odyssella acanthamoebae TaxID=91604 RepID=UPI00056F2D4E|nr:DNA gyrase subunit A [Candidatus Paracaedibacter acanthamoebae]